MVRGEKFILIFVLIGILFFSGIINSSININSINLNPSLDISFFGEYNVTANITNSSRLNNVYINISTINGDDQNSWNFYINGTPEQQCLNFEMQSISEDLWVKKKIYPDYIYPEIFFAPSETTWYNMPQNISMWRRSYHLFNFTNSFSMTSNMSFWVEFNSIANNMQNSNNLFVYIIGNGSTQIGLDYFESDWREKENTELFATLERNENFHHTHTENSSHRLVTISTNPDGTIGNKNLNLSHNFWVVLYQDSVNINRGWNLRYHDTSLCNNQNSWYIGDRSGGGTWNTPNFQDGCPDVHIHIARRNNEVKDGVNVSLLVIDENLNEAFASQAFYFLELPNLAPNPTSFITPIVGNIYNESILNITWNPATDPNEGDILNYTIYLLNSDLTINDTLVEETQINYYEWDITSIEDSKYSLKLKICDQEPLCINATLGGNFTIERVEEINSLLEITISSNNTINSSKAKTGDKVSLRFTSTGILKDPLIQFFSGGYPVNNEITITNTSTEYNITYIVNSSDFEGEKTFIISSEDLIQIYTYSTDGSIVLVDNSGPVINLISPLNESSTTLNYMNFTFEVFDLITIEKCNLILNGEVNKTLTNPQRDSQNGIYVSGLDVGSYNWSINCTDLIENKGESEVWSFEIILPEKQEEVSFFRAASGNPIFYANKESLERIYNKIIYQNWKIKFEVEEKVHTLNLDKIETESAVFTISSTPQTKKLIVGEEWKVDLTKNGIYDILVTLNSIKGLGANVSLNYFQEEIKFEGEVLIEEEILENEVEKNFIWLGVVIGILIVLFLFLILNKKKERKKYNLRKRNSR